MKENGISLQGGISIRAIRHKKMKHNSPRPGHLVKSRYCRVHGKHRNVLSGDDAIHNDVICRAISRVIFGDISQVSVISVSQQHLDVGVRIDTDVTREGCRVERRAMDR